MASAYLQMIFGQQQSVNITQMITMVVLFFVISSYLAIIVTTESMIKFRDKHGLWKDEQEKITRQ